MLIYPLWLTSYHSGTGEQFFKSSMKSLGNKVETCPVDLYGCEYNLIEMIAKDRPDLIFHVPYKDNFRFEVIKQLTDEGLNTLCWNGDDEWLWDTEQKHNPKFIARDYKWNVTTCEGSISKYKEIGVTPILSQWGYSSFDWKFKKRKRDIDIYFCGASTPERDKYLRVVNCMGVGFAFDGPGYGVSNIEGIKSEKVVGFDGNTIVGKVPFNVMLERYQRAKISVSFLMGESGNKPYRQVKARAFEIPATGCFQLAYNAPEIERFFKIGEEIDVFENELEMKEKISFYLKRDALREKMARKAQQRNLEYSYEKILSKVFKRIGL
jgi:spore maturation protein CgeB